jgi:hypothetical protein
MKYKLVHFKPKWNHPKYRNTTFSIGLLPGIGLKEKMISGLSPYKYGERFHITLSLSGLKNTLDLGKV